LDERGSLRRLLEEIFRRKIEAVIRRIEESVDKDLFSLGLASELRHLLSAK
jgi:DNA primase large subunit